MSYTRGMRRIATACLLASALVLSAGVPGSADEPTGGITGEIGRGVIGDLQGEEAAAGTTQVTALTASVSSRTVRPSGTAAFGGQDLVRVGDDLRGDNGGGEAGAAIGLDIDDLLMAYPSPGQPNLQFAIRLAGMTGGGLPEGVMYNWDIAVDGGIGAGGSNWSIKTMRSSQYYSSGSTAPYAAIFECADVPPTGISCSQKDRVTASYDQASATITITVPLSKIGAKAGSRITAWPRNGQPVWIRLTASAAYTLGDPTADDATHDPYTVPTKTVRLGLAPAGTPENLVTYPIQGDLTDAGSFEGTLLAPGPGSFDVWARACFGENCGTRSARVTVASLL